MYLLKYIIIISIIYLLQEITNLNNTKKQDFMKSKVGSDKIETLIIFLKNANDL